MPPPVGPLSGRLNFVAADCQKGRTVVEMGMLAVTQRSRQLSGYLLRVASLLEGVPERPLGRLQYLGQPPTDHGHVHEE